jgi:FAD synthase
VRLFFLERLREERKFPSVIELKEQIQRDIADSRSWFGARGRAGDA